MMYLAEVPDPKKWMICIKWTNGYVTKRYYKSLTNTLSRFNRAMFNPGAVYASLFTYVEKGGSRKQLQRWKKP